MTTNLRQAGYRAGWLTVKLGAVCLPAYAQSVTTVSAPPIIMPIAPSSAESPYAVHIKKIIVQTSPLSSSGINIAKAAQAVQIISKREISQNGAPDALRALQRSATGVNLDNAAGNPYQPSLFYHGFEISPLQGTSQGLAVYVDGVRFNEAFGDTVNWDLLPEPAIRRLTVEDANPVFGLNALGGAVDVQLKDGFSYHGGEIEALGGSFGRAELDAQYGVQKGDISAYFAASERHEGGWRQDQSSNIQNFYGNLGWRGAHAQLNMSLTLARSALNGPGTTPVQLLAVGPNAQYTSPNFLGNHYAKFATDFSDRINRTNAIQAVIYYDYFLQKVSNGNGPNDLPCFSGSPYLCTSPGVLSTTRGLVPIPNFLNSNFYSELDQESTNTNGYGGSLQWTNTTPIAGHHNHLVAGVSFDGSQTEFDANGLLGGITPLTRAYYGPGIVIDEPGINIPVRAAFQSAYEGVYGSDTFDATKKLSITASARINAANLNAFDQGGNAGLTGQHFYSHLNPAIGAAYQLTPLVTLYGGYSEANRNPTPAELSCAGPQNACSLANFFVNDPNLKQVTARTWEAGVRGAALTGAHGTLTYQADYYHTVLNDDIGFINAPTIGRAYFNNIGNVLRTGIDFGLHYTSGPWRAYFDYSFTRAVYQTAFVESGGGNPAANASGTLTIVPGDHFPGIPASQIKFGAGYRITPQWSVGASAVAVTSSYLFGDAANLNKPLPGYMITDLTSRYHLTPKLELFATLENVLNATAYSYGGFSSLGNVYVAQVPNLTNPRAYSPVAPVGAYGGFKVKF
ncbi:TonB-dependent receptor [Acidiphilium sp. PA]|uniref:TonB-dependent receptor n=1 Tax=Acidiphilium sp. PA TaxID=2871705 RepID=UPI002243BA36|nr:TonB-dependent receptor [Acidiphilium sp. PA]MCW8308028.1 TonB-dependent receptor [Acidiphilium sp. PA]